MTTEPLFCALDSMGIARLIRTADRSVIYAGPGIQVEPAKAIVEVAQRIGPETMVCCIDFDERVLRMGYGDIAAVDCLREAGVVIGNVPGLRIALLIVDEQGFSFTPTALYLEAEPHGAAAPNAMRLSRQQVIETLARLSPAAKAIALTQSATPEERDRIAAVPIEVGTAPITEAQFSQVDASLKEAPPVKFSFLQSAMPTALRGHGGDATIIQVFARC